MQQLSQSKIACSVIHAQNRCVGDVCPFNKRLAHGCSGSTVLYMYMKSGGFGPRPVLTPEYLGGRASSLRVGEQDIGIGRKERAFVCQVLTGL